MGQRSDLFGGERDAQAQAKRILAGDGVVHQVAKRGFVAGQAGKVALSRAVNDGLANQALFVEAVAEALLRNIGIVAQLTEHVVRTEKVLQAGEGRVGLNQVVVRATGIEVKHPILALREAEARQGQRIHHLLIQIRRQLRFEGDLSRDRGAGCRGVRVPGASGHIGKRRVDHTVVEPLRRVDLHIASGLYGRVVILDIAQYRFVGFARVLDMLVEKGVEITLDIGRGEVGAGMPVEVGEVVGIFLLVFDGIGSDPMGFQLPDVSTVPV